MNSNVKLVRKLKSRNKKKNSLTTGKNLKQLTNFLMKGNNYGLITERNCLNHFITFLQISALPNQNMTWKKT